MRILPLLFVLALLFGCDSSTAVNTEPESQVATLDLKEAAIIADADKLLTADIVAITDFVAERSAGGLHDYYSEGRYWWPDPENPDGPYIRRDGISNPNNFSGHQTAMRQLSKTVTTLTAAYELTGDDKYALRAIEHVKAWFVNPATLMNPRMLYGQAIKGRVTGRGIGIIDTLRLINVALSIELLRNAGIFKGEDLAATERWFGEFGDWLTTHEYGLDEKNNNNNHSTWWGAQVAAFARVANRADLTAVAEEQFRNQLPIQIATDGSMPDELGRTKPWHYLYYNLMGWGTFAEILSLGGEDFWEYEFSTTLAPYVHERPKGSDDPEPVAAETLTLADAFAYALPYLEAPDTWPYTTELSPKAHTIKNDFMVFAAWGLDDDRYLSYWGEFEEEQGEEEGNYANLVVWKKIKGLE